ncbi:MAG: N-formylglutamate amidohydrolase [Sulfitobacter sp.]
MTSNLQSVAVTNAQAQSSVVLVCEHASHFIPDEYDGLGLSQDALISHIAWDPGALTVSQHLCAALDAKLVAGCVSRLIYDCNRPPDAANAMPQQSELTIVPGNADLSDDERAHRIARIYTPFRDKLAETLNDTARPVIVTIHSFTPVYKGQMRHVDIGILHDTDTALADQMLAEADAFTDLRVLRNAPYGPEDGVTHTLREHGVKFGRRNVMIEVRNDLIANCDQQNDIAAMLARWLASAVEHLPEGDAV